MGRWRSARRLPDGLAVRNPGGPGSTPGQGARLFFPTPSTLPLLCLCWIYFVFYYTHAHTGCTHTYIHTYIGGVDFGYVVGWIGQSVGRLAIGMALPVASQLSQLAAYTPLPIVPNRHAMPATTPSLIRIRAHIGGAIVIK